MTVPWRPPPERECNSMKMELIQPFINAADAVLSQGLQGSTKVGNLTMEEDAYRRKGVAGMIALTGDIEGRIILDLEPQTAVKNLPTRSLATPFPPSTTRASISAYIPRSFLRLRRATRPTKIPKP